MAIIDTFEKLNLVFTAIKDIDRINNLNSKEKIDSVNNAVKNLDKKLFDEETAQKISDAYREGLVKIYNSYIESLNVQVHHPEISEVNKQPESTEQSKTTNITIDGLATISKDFSHSVFGESEVIDGRSINE